MDRATFVAALAGGVPKKLAEDLVDSFLDIRRDVATSTLGRSAPGKFAESMVQVLQHLALGKYSKKPKVDEFLRNLETSAPALDDGLRICGARIARAMYTLRNRRSIAHKGDVDPNTYDLRFLLSAAQWLLAEIIRLTAGLPMEDAGRLVEGINTPVGGLVEDFGGKRLVHGSLTVREEALVLLHSYHPTPRLPKQVAEELDRRSAGTVNNELRKLWRGKLIEGDVKGGYRLTKLGLNTAIDIIQRELGT